jgi:hypothetical protein
MVTSKILKNSFFFWEKVVMRGLKSSGYFPHQRERGLLKVP